MPSLLPELVSRRSIRSTGSRSLCVLGRIKKTSLVGMHKVYPLVDSSKYPAYRLAYWLIHPCDDGKYVVLNVLFL
jgi:hypothetical protein